MQSNSNQTGADWESIYRKVQDRWLQIGPNMEDVVLTRINGQLKLNMGVLPNQFATKVTQITVKLTQVPRYVYVRDNANDEVYTEEATTYTYRFTPDPSVYWDQGENAPEYILYFNLLPFTLDATGTVAVTEVGGTTHTYPLTGDSKPIAIGKNKRTTVHFNGIDQAFFEVRYAGFDDTGIDVDGDEWDGWQDSPATTNP